MLLAKSFAGSNNITNSTTIPRYAKLEEHCFDAYYVATKLVELVGKNILINFGLPVDIFYNKLKKCAKISAILHDIGKANDIFQPILTGQWSAINQMVRHEFVSALILQNKNVENWLKEQFELDQKTYYFILWAILGHHRKFDGDKKFIGEYAAQKNTIYSNNIQIKAIFDKLAEEFNVKKIEILPEEFSITPDDAKAINFTSIIKFAKFSKKQITKQDAVFVNVLKAILIASDVSSSAIAGNLPTTEAIVSEVEAMLNVGIKVEDFDGLINNWAVNNNISNIEYKNFQKELQTNNSKLILVEAGCGGGKSLGAYLWGKQWCEKYIKENKTFKLMFCLPTTGTSTEQFKDYALNSGIPSYLYHSRSAIDLSYMLNNTHNDDVNAIREIQENIDALKMWATPLAIATSDTVLNYFNYSQKALCALPSFSQTVFVFDEIHSFDNKMFDYLLRFLDTFKNVPILLMTASLPQARKSQLKTIRPDIEFIKGEEKDENIIRYKFNNNYSLSSLFGLVQESVDNNKKILIVKNTVKSANSLYQYYIEKFGSDIVSIYHSRFRYKDRCKIHRKVIDQFKKPGTPTILISTQVAEMSLDLSADLLITDDAPISSLIQRLGRLNRRAKIDDPWDVYFIDVLDRRSTKPYDVEEIKIAKKWIEKIIQNRENGCSQADLAIAWCEVSPNTQPISLDFLNIPGTMFSRDGCWKTSIGSSCREPGYTYTVVLDFDYDDLIKTKKEPTKSWFREFELSIPLHPQKKIKSFDDCAKIKGIYVVPSFKLNYDFDEIKMTGTGASWVE